MTTLSEVLKQMFTNPDLQKVVKNGGSLFVSFCPKCQQDFSATEEHDCVPPQSRVPELLEEN